MSGSQVRLARSIGPGGIGSETTDDKTAALACSACSMSSNASATTYFALIETFVQRYDKSAGVGTVIALMLPYAVVLLAVWTVLVVVWHALGIPFGPGETLDGH